jgi:outer membrane protein OmpA-like peptidoglycan-associated protein
MTETIGRQTASYRQGLVLGLTMAEIMLLLAFCLLIAVGVALANERLRRNAALERLQKVEQIAAADETFIGTMRKNPRLAELVDRSESAARPKDIDEFWRKLVESNDFVAAMERQGVPLAALREESGSFVALKRANEKVDPDKIVRALALASAIDGALPADTKLAPREIAALLEKGLAASSAAADEKHTGSHDWPPIINLSEAGGYYFATGSAELTPDFAAELRTVVVTRLLQIAASFDVDVIEVIGHTDEQPVTNHASNLDRSLRPVTQGESNPGVLQWADNAGLGLARALAVVNILSADPRLKSFRILPLSAAQLIDTDGRLTRWGDQGDVRERRRIEIRMRKSA